MSRADEEWEQKSGYLRWVDETNRELGDETNTGATPDCPRVGLFCQRAPTLPSLPQQADSPRLELHQDPEFLSRMGGGPGGYRGSAPANYQTILTNEERVETPPPHSRLMTPCLSRQIGQ